jgi:hypothetical protein
MRSSFTRVRRPREIPLASLAGNRRCTPAVESLWLVAGVTHFFRSSDLRNWALSPTQESDAAREGRFDPMRARISALGGRARASYLVCRSR